MKRLLLVVLIIATLTACQPVTVFVTERDIGDGKTVIETATPRPPVYTTRIGGELYRLIDEEFGIVCYWRYGTESLSCLRIQ